MQDVLMKADLFQGFSLRDIRRLYAISATRELADGDYLFLLGDSAECLYVVTAGSVDLCLPMNLGGTLRDIPVESATAGKALGWSALVKPYRFTLSARAAGPAQVAGFRRGELQRTFARSPELAHRFLANLSELMGVRLLTFQALWVRELQRSLTAESLAHSEGR